MLGSRERGGLQVWLSLWSLTSMSPIGRSISWLRCPPAWSSLSGCLSQTPFSVISRKQLEATSTSEAIPDTLDTLDTSSSEELIGHPNQKEKQTNKQHVVGGYELADAPLTEMRGADSLLQASRRM